MKDKIAAFLKGKIEGISETYLNVVAVHYAKTILKEEDIETTLNTEAIELLTLNFEELQKEGDRRATSAGETALKTFKTKFKLDDEGKTTEKVVDPPEILPKTTPEDQPAWFTKYLGDQKIRDDVVKDKLDGIDKKELQAKLSVKVIDKLKELKIPETFYKGRNLDVESEGDIEELTNTVKTDWDGFVQDQADNNVEVVTPESSENESKLGDEAAKAAAELRNKSSTDPQGGIEI